MPLQRVVEEVVGAQLAEDVLQGPLVLQTVHDHCHRRLVADRVVPIKFIVCIFCGSTKI